MSSQNLQDAEELQEQENQKKQGERNPGASVLQKLKNHARSAGEEMTVVLSLYIIQRFLYRLSQSRHRNRFILRGATLFSVWSDLPHRPTRDVDLLATGENSPSVMGALFREICSVPVPEDGVSFLMDTLSITERKEGRVYPGLHLEVTAALGTARPRLEIDIAVGEAVTPAPQEAEIPALLSLPAPRLLIYPRETAMAEKIEAIVTLGLSNTRLKDFFDLWYISRVFPVSGALLSEALRSTFQRRGTAFPAEGFPAAFTERFYGDSVQQVRWAAFQKKVMGNRGRMERDAPSGVSEGASVLSISSVDLTLLINDLKVFLVPPLAALSCGESFERNWSSQSGWRKQEESIG